MKKLVALAVVVIVIVLVVIGMSQCGKSSTSVAKLTPPPPQGTPIGGVFTGKIAATQKAGATTTIYFTSGKYITVLGDWDLNIGLNYVITVTKVNDNLRIDKVEVR